MKTTKASFQKYPAYKDSGLEWLGQIPEHWEVKKLKFLGNIYSGLNGKKGDDFNKEFIDNSKAFVPFTNICNNNIIDEKQYQYVRIKEHEIQNKVLKNDILFLMSSETLDDIAKNSIYLGNDSDLYLNSFCKGFRLKCIDIFPEFINYLFISKSYRNYFSSVGRGFTRVNLKQEYVNDAFTLLPPLQEQTTIAQFLDDKTTKIDQAIAQKQKMITLLKERKQIIIQDLVTGKKVWNPTENTFTTPTRVKDSGVEWIGMIPEEWGVEKGKWLYVQQKRPVRNEDDIITCFRDGQVTLRKNRKTDGFTNALKEHGYQGIRYGDLVIHNMDAFAGAIGVSDSDGKSTPVYSVCTERKADTVNSLYYAYYLRELARKGYIQALAKGIRERSTDFRFNDFANLEYALPPLSEQNSIVSQIEAQSAKIDHAILLQEQQIEKLKEYKTTLIDAVVTGKIKVI